MEKLLQKFTAVFSGTPKFRNGKGLYEFQADVLLNGLNFADAYSDDVEVDTPSSLTKHPFELRQVLERLRHYTV